MAGEALDDLRDCCQAHSVWLDLGTCLEFKAFLTPIRDLAFDYLGNLVERGYPTDQEGLEVGRRVLR